MALSLVILRARRVQGGSGLRLFQATMVLFVLSGGVGTWLHYQGNAEFEKEMYPSLSWVELFWQSLTGATPGPGAGCHGGAWTAGVGLHVPTPEARMTSRGTARMAEWAARG